MYQQLQVAKRLRTSDRPLTERVKQQGRIVARSEERTVLRVRHAFVEGQQCSRDRCFPFRYTVLKTFSLRSDDNIFQKGKSGFITQYCDNIEY